MILTGVLQQQVTNLIVAVFPTAGEDGFDTSTQHSTHLLTPVSGRFYNFRPRTNFYPSRLVLSGSEPFVWTQKTLYDSGRKVCLEFLKCSRWSKKLISSSNTFELGRWIRNTFKRLKILFNSIEGWKGAFLALLESPYGKKMVGLKIARSRKCWNWLVLKQLILILVYYTDF